jgi:hypothetical protein
LTGQWVYWRRRCFFAALFVETFFLVFAVVFFVVAFFVVAFFVVTFFAIVSLVDAFFAVALFSGAVAASTDFQSTSLLHQRPAGAAPLQTGSGRACVGQLFESAGQVLDAENIYAQAKALA